MVHEEEDRKRNFMAKAQEQRQKIYSMKNNQEELLKEFDLPNFKQAEAEPELEKPQKLTQENLSRIDEKSQKSQKSKSQKTKQSKKSQKPAWAMTEEQLEEQKEAEIDDLLEFAYDLDYDQYMNDFEIRQVFSIIKDRVNEIKQD